jgi:hypothetical protein
LLSFFLSDGNYRPFIFLKFSEKKLFLFSLENFLSL